MVSRFMFFFPGLSALTILFCGATAALEYPEARKTDQVDEYFGTRVADPYRWLEDDRAAETAEWVRQENRLTESFLSRIPFREEIRQEMTRRFDYVKYSVPFKKGNRLFFFKN